MSIHHPIPGPGMGVRTHWRSLTVMLLAVLSSCRRFDSVLVLEWIIFNTSWLAYRCS